MMMVIEDGVRCTVLTCYTELVGGCGRCCTTPIGVTAAIIHHTALVLEQGIDLTLYKDFICRKYK